MSAFLKIPFSRKAQIDKTYENLGCFTREKRMRNHLMSMLTDGEKTLVSFQFQHVSSTKYNILHPCLHFVDGRFIMYFYCNFDVEYLFK